jgi:hypothetical protein
MRIYLIFLLLAVVFFTGLSGGCSAPKAAEEVAISYYKAIQNKDLEKALDYYSPKFLEKTPRDDLIRNLNQVNKKLGDLKTYELVSWKTTKYMGVGELPSGTYYELQYKVEYTKYPANEMLTLYKSSSNEDILIFGFNINSSGFLEE